MEIHFKIFIVVPWTQIGALLLWNKKLLVRHTVVSHCCSKLLVKKRVYDPIFCFQCYKFGKIAWLLVAYENAFRHLKQLSVAAGFDKSLLWLNTLSTSAWNFQCETTQRVELRNVLAIIKINVHKSIQRKLHAETILLRLKVIPRQ